MLVISILLTFSVQSYAAIQLWTSSRDMSKRLTPGSPLTLHSDHVSTKPMIRINAKKDVPNRYRDGMIIFGPTPLSAIVYGGFPL